MCLQSQDRDRRIPGDRWVPKLKALGAMRD